MGLCSGCRRVTNLFCFNHRKNVCDQCMLTGMFLPELDDVRLLLFAEPEIANRTPTYAGQDWINIQHSGCVAWMSSIWNTNIHPSPDNTTPTAKDVREKLKDAGSRRNPHGTASLVPTPSEASLSVSVNGLPYNASPRSPLSAHSVHTPLDSTHPNRQISRKSSQRNVTDSDADKYGRRSDPDGLLAVIRRHCGGRFSSKRIISLILVVLILFGMLTLSFFHANLPGTSPR
ncbi:hypothetical protein PhCBS80983_g04685 [Powellomyces hirtus]|uniref:ZFPL1-like B-box zinc-binding domain-containing protein n=1 Tax=Powellomyces hirtus TaxID=109895 RepID=A0A507DWQ2_9FUNG|nr:hypothetical protein PhCBS80983_g04685 [Powellomyces hirtus]